MQQRLRPSTVFLLVFPPLTWAANAIVGRLIYDQIPPMTLNLLRWLTAFVLLLPLGYAALRRDSPMWPRWRHYGLLGLLGVGTYNSLQYLALHTSQPLNVSLVGSGVPIWMLLVGRICYGEPVRRVQVAGALLSMCGVLTVLSRGSLDTLLAFHLVPGDAYVVLATISWSFYSWMLARPSGGGDALRNDWAPFLLAQIFFGCLWSGLFSAAEWTLGDPHIEWNWKLAAAVLFIGLFPALIAYRSFGAAVARTGPAMAVFSINLTPIFTALLTVIFLGQTPSVYHLVAFALIVGGIVISSRK